MTTIGDVSEHEFLAAVGQQMDAMEIAFHTAWDQILDFFLSPKGGHSLEIQFDHFDEDGSGNLSFDELRKGLLRCGVQLSPREFRLFVKSIDSSGDGEVSLCI